MVNDVTERLKAEEMIQEKSAQLKTISDNLPGLLIYQLAGKNYDDRRFTFFSNEITKLTGKSPEEVMRDPTTLYNIIHPEDRPMLIAKEKEAYENRKNFDAEVRVQMPTGEIRYIHLTSVPRVTIDGEWVWDGFQLDVTERIRSEQAIRQSNERFELVSRATRDIIWDWNMKKDHIWRNENYHLLFGYSTEDQSSPVKKSWWGHVHPSDRKKVSSGIYSCIRERRSFWREEYRFMRADGTSAIVNDCGYILYDAEGNPYRMVGAMEDITSLKMTQQELQESFDENKLLAERLSSILNTLPARVALLDKKGFVMEVNEVWRNFYRVIEFESENYGIGEDYPLFTRNSACVKEDGVNMSRGIKSVLNGTASEFVYEYPCNKTKPQSWFRMFVTPLENEKYSGAVVMHTDITLLRQLEEDKLKAKTEEQRKVTEAMLKGQEKERNAIAIELHDNVNQILTGTKIMLSLLKEFPEKAGEVVPMCVENLELAVTENRNIAHELVTPNLKKEDLIEQIERLAGSMLHTAGYKTEIIRRNYMPGMLDAEKQLALYRILQEQCTNIVKYSEGSEVTFGLESKGNLFRLNIKDNGKGMAEDKVHEGIGLRNIASRLDVFGGSLHIETAPGKGFNLIIEIPNYKSESMN